MLKIKITPVYSSVTAGRVHHYPVHYYAPLKFAALAITVTLSVLFSACSSHQLIVPSITPTPTGTYQTGKFIWFDLITNDVEAAKRFYGGLFGWEFEDENPADLFTLIKYRGKPLGGIVFGKRLKQQVSESRWLSYLSVPDVDKATEYINTNGGTLYRKPAELPHRGRYAVVSDPQGALFALLKASNGDPPDEEPEMGEWLWNELLTSDANSAVSFYEEFLGYQHEAIEVRENVTYYILKQDDKPRAGVLKSPWEEVKPNWLPYVRVENPAGLIEQVKSLGGQVLLAPDPDIRKGSVAIIADPSGAVVSIQKWPIEDEERSDSP